MQTLCKGGRRGGTVFHCHVLAVKPTFHCIVKTQSPTSTAAQRVGGSIYNHLGQCMEWSECTCKPTVIGFCNRERAFQASTLEGMLQEGQAVAGSWYCCPLAVTSSVCQRVSLLRVCNTYLRMIVTHIHTVGYRLASYSQPSATTSTQLCQ
jgi:hypothetical protein